MAALMDRLASNQTTQSSYPPYNIEKTDAETYRISLAVAGFSDQDLNVDVKENTLSITAQKPQTEAEGRYLHRGIATRSFERHFHLADHIRVNGASHADGMLHVELKHEIPEALKPRRIEISSGDGTNAPRPALN
jgi:molecular chaperone IbpA